MRLLLVLILCVSVPAAAQGDASVAYLSQRLEKAKDPRARVNAALGLGSTDEPEAVVPLCTALKDDSPLVRDAAIKGLRDLKEVSALDCLKAHKEADAATQTTLRAVIKSLEALKSQRPRLYVAFLGLKDKTGTLPAELVTATEARLKRKLLHSGALLAPPKEAKKAAQGVLKKHGISGYRLSAEIQSTEGGGLRIAVVCLSYPDLALLGQAEVQAAGAPPAVLLKALAPKVIEEVAATLEWST
jgi:hypothetical protein